MDIAPNRKDSGPRGKEAGHRPLRIAMVAPLYERVPPLMYGGTERVVSYLTEEMVRRGHEVTLFASGDSRTSASLRPGCPTALRLCGMDNLGPAYQLGVLKEVFEDTSRFDIVHAHIDYWVFPFARLLGMPTLTTLHGRLDIESIAPIYRQFPEARVVSISDAQRGPLPDLNWLATVHHGLPDEHLRFNPRRGSYLAFLGRISPEKRPDLAIEIARRTGLPLKIAAKVDRFDQEYFETVIEPMLGAAEVEFIGEIGEADKSEFLGNAYALLFPIDWPEPFGLVMIESLACGTPVIARPCGSVPEVLRHGVTGLVYSQLDDLVRAVDEAGSLSREACREEFEKRFKVDVMAASYERLYWQLIAEHQVHAERDGAGWGVGGAWGRESRKR